MRHLYLVRHAKSSWDNPLHRDFERPLNGRGVDTAPKMAQFLWKLGAHPDLIMTSPARRAIDTAHYFGTQFGLLGDHFVPEPSIYEATPHEIMRIISRLPNDKQHVFLVGHNPTFTEVANLFAGDDPFANIPTCGVVRLDCEAEQWNQLYEGNTRVGAHWFPKIVL